MKYFFWALSLVFSFSVSLLHAQNYQTYKSGDWTVHKSTPPVQLANVTNEAGATTGIICATDDETCLAYILTGSMCTPDAINPMLISSAVGVFAIETTCKATPWSTKEKPSYMNVISEFGSAQLAFEGGGTVGFAYALKGGEFKVLRFSTLGATAAIKSARTPPPSRSPAKKKAAETL